MFEITRINQGDSLPCLFRISLSSGQNKLLSTEEEIREWLLENHVLAIEYVVPILNYKLASTATGEEFRERIKRMTTTSWESACSFLANTATVEQLKSLSPEDFRPYLQMEGAAQRVWALKMIGRIERLKRPPPSRDL